MKFDRTVISFFGLFLLVYFLESIGGFFMTSAIVSIEKQFQIPSKVSGLMVSASDFGYIPTVVFVAYMGGKGNRARWIGAGCMGIAIANVIISSSNFLFPVDRVHLDNIEFERSIERDLTRLSDVKGSFYNQLDSSTSKIIKDVGIRRFFDECDVAYESNQTDSSCDSVHEILHSVNNASDADIANLRAITGTSYAFCDRMLNRLRSMMQKIRCSRDVSNVGPTATIFIGLLLLGVGRTMPFSLGLPLIDDNVRKANLPLYFAGMFFIRIMGPVLGLLIGSLFNKFYYTFDPPRGLSPRDPLWIGCWWAGFLAIGIVLFGPSLGLFCFKAPEPKKEEEVEKESEASDKFLDEIDLNSEKTDRTEKPVKKTHKKRSSGLALVDRHLDKDKDGEAIMPETFKGKAIDFFTTIRTVLKQPIYFGILIGRIIDVMAFKGFFIFLPKYLEIQFGVPQYKINMYMGIIGIIGFAIGVISGSLLMKKLKLEGRRAAGWVAICSLLAGCLSFLNAGVSCRSTLTALGELPDNGLGTRFTCASACFCDNTLYPVCDRSGKNVFFSPCHAGCAPPNITEFATLDPTIMPSFANCSCANNGAVSRDFCEQADCDWKVKLYFLNMALGGMFGGLGVTPGMLIMLRSVPAKYRSVSLGFNGFLVSLLATLPSPTLWGALIDRFCVLWEKKCDGQGACLLYATNELRIWMHCIYGALRLFALIFDAYVFYHAKDLKIIEEDDEESENDSPDSKKENQDEKPPEYDNIKHHKLVIDPKDDVHKPKHKKSASREISLLLNDQDKEDGEHGTSRRLSRQSHHSDYVAGEIATITSNGVI